jgi:hypothetical protein
MSVAFHQSGRAHAILADLVKVTEEGYEKKALQRLPHLTLLNAEWYHEEMRPVMARWIMLWLEANHVGGLTSEEMHAYINSSGDDLVGVQWSAEVEAAAAEREAASGLPPEDTADKERAARALRRLHAHMERLTRTFAVTAPDALVAGESFEARLYSDTRSITVPADLGADREIVLTLDTLPAVQQETRSASWGAGGPHEGSVKVNGRPRLTLKSMRLLNIASEWLRIFMPHCIQVRLVAHA